MHLEIEKYHEVFDNNGDENFIFVSFDACSHGSLIFT